MRNNFYLKIIKWGAILIVFVTPFLAGLPVAYPTVFSKAIFFRIVVEIIFIFYVLLAISDSRYRPRLSLISVSIAVFFLILVISAFSGANLYRSFWGTFSRMEGLVTIGHLVVFFFILIYTFPEPQFWLKLFQISLIASLFIGLHTIISGIFTCGQIDCVESLMTFLGNSSFLAFFSLFHVFLAWLFFLQENKKALRLFYLFILILNFSIIFLSGNMGAAAAVLFGLLFFTLFYIFFASISKTKKSLIFGMIFISILLFVVFVPIVRNKIKNQPWIQEIPFLQKLTQISLEMPAIRDRLIVWQAASRAWQERLLLGWGWENYEIAYHKYFTPQMSNYIPLSFDRVHNKILDVGVMSGILGLLSYLFIFFSIFYVLIKILFQREVGFRLVGAIIALLIAYFINNLFLFDTLNSYILFFLIVGFVEILYRSELSGRKEYTPEVSEKKNSSLKVSYSLILGLVILVGFFSYHVNIKPTLAAHYGYLGYYWQIADYQKSLGFYRKSLDYSTYGDPVLRVKLAILVVETKQIGPFSKQRIEDLKYAIGELKKNIGTPPDLTDFESYILLGKAYNLLGDIDKSYLKLAEEAFQEALKINKFRIDTYRLLADTKTLQNDLEGALAYFSQVKDLNIGTSEPYQNSGKLYLMMGENQKALAELDKVIEIEKKLGRTQWDYFTSLFYFYEEKLQNDIEGTLAFYSTIKELNLGRSWPYINSGKLYLTIGDIERALTELETALKIEKESGSPQWLGSIVGALDFYAKNLEDNPEGALAFYLLIEDFNVEIPRFYWNSGALYLKINEKEKALIRFEKAIEIEDKLGHLHALVNIAPLFALYEEKKEFHKLIPLYEEAIEYRKDIPVSAWDPNSYKVYLDLYKSLAYSYAEVGETEKAKDTISKLLEINPDSYNEVQGFLESLE